MERSEAEALPAVAPTIRKGYALTNPQSLVIFKFNFLFSFLGTGDFKGSGASPLQDGESR